MLVICYTEISIEVIIKMISNQANEPDGSYHVRVEPKKKPKPIPKDIPKVETKEVKNDKKRRK